MPLKRTPPQNTSTEPPMDTAMPVNYASDSELITSNAIMSQGHDLTTPKFVFRRNKRARESDDCSSQFNNFKEEVKELITSLIADQKRDLVGINSNLKDIQETNSNIEKSISLLTSQNEEFRRKIELLESQAKKDREYIYILENKIEDLQRTSRKTSVELKNVPKKPQESRDDLINMVTCLSRSINMEMNAQDIRDIYRLKSNNDAMKNPTIILELCSSIKRTDLLKKTKEFNIKNKIRLQAKHLGHTKNEDTPVFISEHLTARAARLFFLARDLVRSRRYKYCWSAYGKVFVRKDDSSRIILIQNEAQITHLQQEK